MHAKLTQHACKKYKIIISTILFIVSDKHFAFCPPTEMRFISGTKYTHVARVHTCKVDTTNKPLSEWKVLA